MEDQNPGLDGSGEGLDTLELEPTVIEPKEEGGDPLDDIQDEVARAEAKKHRSIARRTEKKPEKVIPTTIVPTSSEFLTKADFQKSNERKAVREVTSDPEVKAVWNEIIPFYTPRRGKETPEDIKEDIQDAITLYRARNPVIVKDDSKDQLSTTTVAKTGGGGTSKEVVKTAEPPNFKLPSQPKDWYSKK